MLSSSRSRIGSANSIKSYAKMGKWKEICNWITMLAENTTLHGVVWYTNTFSLIQTDNSFCTFIRYTKTDNKMLKFFIMSLSMAMIVLLPTLLFVQYVDFINSDSVSNAVEWVPSNNLTYPNITVCHPGYWDMKKMKGTRAESEYKVPLIYGMALLLS